MHATKALLFTLSLASIVGCRFPFRSIPSPSSPDGALSIMDDIIPVPKMKTHLEIQGIGRGLAQRVSSRVSVTSSKGIRPEVKAALFQEIKAADGIPRHQQKGLLEDLVAPESAACDARSCARVFGFEKGDVDNVLDDAYRDVKTSPALLKPEMRATRRMLLGSLQKGKNEARQELLKGPQAVLYKFVKSAAAKDLHIAAKGTNISLDIKPSDLLRTEKIECFKDLCEATLHMPFTVNAGLPMPLNSQVRITYSQTPNQAGTIIEQKASIRGQITPIKIHQILSIAVDFGADFEKSAGTAQKLVVKEVNCKGSISCQLPMVSIEAQVDKDGISFSSTGNATSFDGGLVKVSRDPSRFEKKIKFSDLPKTVQNIKQGLSLVKSGVTKEDMDMLWDEFADLRGAM